MVLLTSGDSWTQGDSPANTLDWEAVKTLDWYDIPLDFGSPYATGYLGTRVPYKFYNSDVWPKVLGKKLGLQTINIGRLGTGNAEIALATINTVQRLLNEHVKDILVVVGWSSMLRMTCYTYSTKTGRIQPDQIRPWDDGFSSLYSNHRVVEDNFVFEIFKLQQYLKSKNVKFLFYNAFDTFDNFDNNHFSDLIDKSHWINQDVKSAHCVEYLASLAGYPSNNKMIEGDWFKQGHPTDMAHTKWAEYITEYIAKNKVI